jgi:nitronate monooxygenase
VSALLERLGVELPVVQAGMGGGLACHELAAAVSDAGGLGTIGILDPDSLEGEIAAARRLTGRAIAVNLLLPFARRRHWEVAAAADAVVTFWGRPSRRTEGVWLHQCGTVEEAVAARGAGADGVIAQGVESGGHVRGTTPALELLAAVRAALPDGYPVLLAGGIATAEDLRAALAAGADAAVLGTRFVMSEESRAHPEYKQRLIGSRETVLTELFGAGWPAAPHRVIWNEAAERWLARDRRGPAAVRAINRATAPLIAAIPLSRQGPLLRMQRPAVPFLGPVAPSVDQSSRLVESGPLYAGESVARIDDVRPAAELARELAAA